MPDPESASATNVPPPNTADDARPDDARPDVAGGPDVRRVFYEDWEMECCGTPFSVGDRVSWALNPTTDPMWDWTVNNHGPGPDDPDSVTGLVRSIQLVTEGYRRPAGSHTYEPVPGERDLRPVRKCPKWFADGRGGEPDGRPEHRMAESGVLVELEVPPPGGRDGAGARRR
ncbi:DUF6578 domain-containing protein [Streptomyces sp. NPDC042319]|uniref:DUF6578 domain-containing protein n=1 Tax=Streptomyces sp. NPDC042319 TaxID=3154332 RepID=UPI0033E01F8C